MKPILASTLIGLISFEDLLDFAKAERLLGIFLEKLGVTNNS